MQGLSDTKRYGRVFNGVVLLGDMDTEYWRRF